MSDLVLTSTTNGVTTVTMNLPRRLNGWTREMMDALAGAFSRAAEDDATSVLVLTGTDPYYSAGVNLSGTMELTHPRKLRDAIVEHNRALFDRFIDFDKPVLAAVNGPAIGATATSATLSWHRTGPPSRPPSRASASPPRGARPCTCPD